MQPVIAAQAFPCLFQPYQAPAEIPSLETQRYLEMPVLARENYQTLAMQQSFSAIKAQFLADIDKLKRLAAHYVGSQYANDIDAFRQKISEPKVSSLGSLFGIFVNTRKHIHQIVLWLTQRQSAKDQAVTNDAAIDITDEAVELLLHECLTGITLCFDGIHSRFASVFLTLEAIKGGLKGKIYQTRKVLFHEFIAAYLFKLQRTGICEIPESMEVHWFNALQNLYCERLGLESIVDIFAPRNLPRGLIAEFTKAASYAVNPCTIVRKLVADWQARLLSTLGFLGCQHWLTEKFALDDIPAGHMQDLDKQFFNPINKLCHLVSDEHRLSFEDIVDMDDDCEVIQLNRSAEKLQAWAVRTILQISGIVFAVLSSFRGLYVGTFGEIFFWVFKSTDKLEAGDTCRFSSTDHISLELQHIKYVDFRSWSTQTSFALLTQAINQTEDVVEMVRFFLGKNRQLTGLATPIFDALVSQFNTKLLVCEAKKMALLVDIICHHFVSEGAGLVSPEHLKWLVGSSLLEPVLRGLQCKDIDISYVTPALKTWHIIGFSTESLLCFFSPRELRALFYHALELEQAVVLENLLRTEYLDGEMNKSNSKGQTPLMLFAIKGNIDGLRYLLARAGININQQDPQGLAALHWAAYKGNKACLELLLKTGQININEKDSFGWTVLHRIARNGQQDCLQLLLGSSDIDINAKDNLGRTPLHIAAHYGHEHVISSLLTHSNIMVNTADKYGETPLHQATAKGHLECIKSLLNALHIN